MNDTQGTPRWDGVERRKQPAPPAPPARWSRRQFTWVVLARAGGELLAWAVRILTAYWN